MLNKLSGFAKSELVNGWTAAGYSYLGIGLLLQVIAIVYGFISGTPDNALSIIAGLTGIVSVVLCAKGKISFYLFGYIQRPHLLIVLEGSTLQKEG